MIMQHVPFLAHQKEGHNLCRSIMGYFVDHYPLFKNYLYFRATAWFNIGHWSAKIYAAQSAGCTTNYTRCLTSSITDTNEDCE